MGSEGYRISSGLLQVQLPWMPEDLQQTEHLKRPETTVMMSQADEDTFIGHFSDLGSKMGFTVAVLRKNSRD